MRQLTHLSLFSGIGGLDLAAEAAGFQTVGQCEWADYPTKVLKKHWPDVPRWRDIRTLTGDDFYARTGLRTVDVISGDSPANLFLLPGSSEARQTTVTSGRKCAELSRKSGPLGLLAKMCLESSLWGSRSVNLKWTVEQLNETQTKITTNRYQYSKRECCSTVSSKTSKKPGMRSSHLLFRLQGSMPRTSVPESVLSGEEPTLWKTPVASDAANRKMYVNSRGEPNLSGLVKMFPTPTVMDARASLATHLRADATPTRSILLSQRIAMFPTPTATVATHGGPNQRDSSGRPGLQMAAIMFPTPKARDFKDTMTLPPSRQKDIGKDSLSQRVGRLVLTPTARDYRSPDINPDSNRSQQKTELNSVVGGQLNPTWVEWLMGFPLGWTDLNVLEML